MAITNTNTFKILDGLAFGVLIVLLIIWIIGFLRSIHKNKSLIYTDFGIVKGLEAQRQ